MRALLLVLAGLAACTSPSAPTTTAPPATSGASTPPSGAEPVSPDVGPATSEPAPAPSADRCEPLPRAGDPCGPGDSYCVESWGEPGGWSSALWCREGRWQREEERNLPEAER